MTLKAHRGRCAHCGHDHDAARKMAEYRALATQPPSPPAQVGTSGASAEVSRLAEALLMDAKDSVEDYRDGKEFGAHDRKLIGRLKAALAAMAYPAAKVGTEDADAQAKWPREFYRHVKSGGEYEWLASAVRESDQVVVVMYQSLETGIRWVRPSTEFYDGRFVRIDSPTAPQPPEAMAPAAPVADPFLQTR